MKRHALSPEKNREAILKILEDVLPINGTVLEIGSGTGQHAVFFARRMPSLVWQPSDASADAVDSIAAWRAEAALPNLRAPLQIDVTREAWDVDPVPAIVAIDLMHAAPWAACVGLLTGAVRHLLPRGVLVLYGPFVHPDRPTSHPNLALDADLRRKNPTWGLRNLGEVLAVAASRGLTQERVVDMPSHNVLAVLRRE